MGASFQNILLHRADPTKVNELLCQWMMAKGFELEESPSRAPLNRECERKIVLYSNENWVIVLYNQLEELERLKFELRKLGCPLLYLWLFDSDVWGYELESEGRAVSAFVSNPKYFGAGMMEEPEADNDIPKLCECIGLEGSEQAIRKSQGGYALFKERKVEQFAQIIGADPGTEYIHFFENLVPRQYEGYHCEELVFRDKDYHPLEEFDLHAVFPQRVMPAQPKSFEEALESLPPEFREEIQADIKSLERWQVINKWVIAPLFYIIFIPIKVLLYISRPFMSKKWEEANTDEPEFVVEGNDLYHPGYKCRITLPDNEKVSSESPWHRNEYVFTFLIEGNCIHVAPESVEMVKNVLSVRHEDDKCWTSNGLRIRSLSSEETNRNLGIIDVHYVQTAHGIYKFQSVYGLSPEARSLLKEIVSSFRVDRQEQSP